MSELLSPMSLSLACAQFLMDGLVLAPWLRVSSNAHGLDDRSSVCGDYCEERCAYCNTAPFACSNGRPAAKHLEPLKGGKIPVEILVTTKDQEQKTKSFEKCVEAIKGAGVSLQTHILQAEA